MLGARCLRHVSAPPPRTGGVLGGGEAHQVLGSLGAGEAAVDAQVQATLHPGNTRNSEQCLISSPVLWERLVAEMHTGDYDLRASLVGVSLLAHGIYKLYSLHLLWQPNCILLKNRSTMPLIKHPISILQIEEIFSFFNVFKNYVQD